METTKTNFPVNTMFLSGMVAPLALSMSSFTPKTTILTITVPAAEGQVAAKSDKNDHYPVRIKKTSLACNGGVDHQLILN